jgi:hypothetical protein
LIIAARGVKTAVAMKTISRRFRFVAFGVIVIVAVVSCCNFPFIPDKRILLYSVEIGNEQTGQYVEWKTQGDFDRALDQVCWSRHGGHGWYEFYTDTDRTHRYKPCPPPRGKIRTVKVTKSKAADNIAAGESAVNDPNVMHKIQSPDPGDISAVLKTLKL